MRLHEALFIAEYGVAMLATLATMARRKDKSVGWLTLVGIGCGAALSALFALLICALDGDLTVAGDFVRCASLVNTFFGGAAVFLGVWIARDEDAGFVYSAATHYVGLFLTLLAFKWHFWDSALLNAATGVAVAFGISLGVNSAVATHREKQRQESDRRCREFLLQQENKELKARLEEYGERPDKES